MSEPILKALMQLFAIIAHPESNTQDKRSIVESFLERQLNHEVVLEYIKIFDYYYEIHQEKQKEKSKLKKRTSSSSVKVLKICTEINEELTQQQKIVVLIRLLEFIKTSKIIDPQEIEFVNTVAETFNIQLEEYNRIKTFVIEKFENIDPTPNILIINSEKELYLPDFKHKRSELLKGEIRILKVDSANMYLIRHTGENELYSNSQVLDEDKVHVLRTGSSIRNSRIKPIYYSDIISCFYVDKLASKIVFEAKNVTFKFRGGKTGIHNFKFKEESGRLVGIMGASGAGKSTLLNILNGTNKPTKGEILINGINIHSEPEKIEGLIGHVSQDDLLIEDLTVFQNLYYNAKLCFDNLCDDEIKQLVYNLLQSLGLHEIQDIQVGSPLNKKISGGQRKRLNIALELIREPSVLFLDEPTSGLSSRDSENIMDLLKELALKGKLVIVVIHQPSSEIFKMFDRLVILDTGGYLIYNGDPIDSIIYFKSRILLANWSEAECENCGNVNPEQIFNIIEAKVVDEYGNATQSRKVSPIEWENYYKEYSKDIATDLIPDKEIPKISFKIPKRLKQFWVFVKRDVLSKLSNTQYLAINLIEAPLLAFILSYIIKFYNVNVTNTLGYTFAENSNVPVYIFMSVIIALFMGLTVSAEEIIRDRKILKREAFLNLSRASYLFSKIAVQFTISAIQAFTFIIVGNSIIEIRGMYFEYWLVLFTAWSCANLLGLVISDSFKTVITIYILIPFLIIPQLILSGIIVKFEKLNPQISSPSEIPFYGEIITARWAYEALAVYQFMENKYEKQFYELDKAMSIADFKKNYWLKKLQNKIDFCERHYNNPEKIDEVIENLTLLRSEIGKELKDNPKVKFQYIEQLQYHLLNPEIIEAVNRYIKYVNNYYIQLYNLANNKKDKIISSQQKSPEKKEAFLNLKRKYHNENLAELVTNSGEVERIIEYKGKLIQKIDPIFLDPSSNFIKAHFYTPRKKLFGNFYSTFWINILVIWFSNITLYIILYYKGLKRLMDLVEIISNRLSKEKEIELE
ncbi:MAG: ATP-binding cassette domain-containing protein [Bacteroidales bacterium]|nr:ATP-binding cassette domain-containing protein [Bacteroidales bacterium]